MEPFCFWMSWMWICPTIGIVCMLMCLFFRRGWWSRDSCCFPFYHGGSNSVKDKETAIELLNKRYAKGEISKEEYECIKSDIMK